MIAWVIGGVALVAIAWAIVSALLTGAQNPDEYVTANWRDEHLRGRRDE